MWLCDSQPFSGYWLPLSPCLLVFLIWPQVGGSLSCICLTSSHFLGCPLVSGVSLSGSQSQGESSSLSLLIFGTRGPMRLDKPQWYPHWMFCTFRKNTACHWPHIRTGLGPCHLPVNTFFWRTWGQTVDSCSCQCLSVGIKPCSGQFKKLRVQQFVWASPNQAQRLGYLPRNYRQRVGWED
jgi:hypothetical protein